jgi:ribonuclease-3 family protein
MRVELLKGSNLAYIGDAYYELCIRKYLVSKEITNPKKLHKLATNYVSATGHNKIIEVLLDKLTEEELNVFKRGRNSKVHSARKNVKQDEYIASSGFESLIGYLYLMGKEERLAEIIDLSIKVIEGNYE